ncbi:hypothetical protein VNO78_10211 [Psophocarpus tetragonolobus]|uniref:Tetraspanin-2 n=1 Tax=Psophocarpus tetragonolobus TaxID=3891 RepID=A0AAN9SLX9_PSOTE
MIYVAEREISEGGRRSVEKMGVSNKMTAVVNLVGMVASIPIIGSGIWVASKAEKECVANFRWPIIIMGVLILMVSLAGFVGAYWNKQPLLALYLFSMALLILLLLLLLVFAFIVTLPYGSHHVPARAYKEYSLHSFSSWLRNHVTDSSTWLKIRPCLVASHPCSMLTHYSFTADQFFLSPLSPLQSGCCKPPTACGYNYVSPVIWTNPVNPMSDPDCYLWNNDPNQLCYNCSACKAGLLGNLTKEWRKANIILIVAVVVLICVYVIACSAFRNAQTEDLFNRYKQGWV